jgi:UDP-N-acetyl-D-galactosamine dehydrogenase
MATIAVIGLGYVGLPLAVAFAEKHEVVGFDIDAARIDELIRSHDRTGEIAPTALAILRDRLSSDPAAIGSAEYLIVTVPTPVNVDKEPDLTAVLAASRLVGEHMGPNSVVVFESTVWPGLTEEVCAPEIERASGLTWRKDFHLGYSPERINPGDSEHRLGNITKIVAGDTPEIAERLAALYGSINGGNIHVAPDIATAEAAKVIENAQRDINIAFVNEVAQICHKLGLSSAEVLAAAGTKWNFLDFKPGLVGGHCIGVDPYYLAHRARELGHEPEVILAGRQINDSMAGFVAGEIAERLAERNADILVLGLTFKKNVPDLRNSLVAEVIRILGAAGHRVAVHDPHADAVEAKALYDVELLTEVPREGAYGCLIGAVAHDAYAALDGAHLAGLLAANGLVADIAGLWRGIKLAPGLRRWEL